MHEGAESLLIHAKGRGDGLTDGGLAQLAEERGDVSEGGDLHNDPGGRPGHEERAAVVLDEVLFAALHLIVKLRQRPGVNERGGEMRILQVAQRA